MRGSRRPQRNGFRDRGAIPPGGVTLNVDKRAVTTEVLLLGARQDVKELAEDLAEVSGLRDRGLADPEFRETFDPRVWEVLQAHQENLQDLKAQAEKFLLLALAGAAPERAEKHFQALKNLRLALGFKEEQGPEDSKGEGAPTIEVAK